MGPVLFHNKTDQSKAKTLKKVYSGLCETCISQDVCTFPRNGKKSITFCEEFAGEQKQLTAKNGRTILSIAEQLLPKNTAVKTETKEVFQGLCQYCAIRTECTFPKKEGGIWNCDEYADEI